jgi:hypothetical protein
MGRLSQLVEQGHRRIGTIAVIGRKLPVSYQQLLVRIPDLLDELQAPSR